MKKIIFALSFLMGGVLHASGLPEWNYIPRSSYTEVASGGAVLFSSGPIQFVAITVSSASANSYVAIFRSTSATFTADITTQIAIATDAQSIMTTNYIPLYDMLNTSYTYINKVGPSKLIYWIRCPNNNNVGACPGLKSSGQNR